MEKDKKEILELIKFKNYKKAINVMYENIEGKLKERLRNEKCICVEDKNFIKTLDYAIKEFTDEYDVLTYLRNIYLLSEDSNDEKLYELLEIYKSSF